MKRLLPLKGAALLLGLGLATIPLTSHAGATYDDFGCNFNTDGTGSCWGNFRGWQKSASSYNYAYFNTNSTGATTTYQFGAQYYSWGTVKYASCVAGSAFAPVWPIVMSNEGYFIVFWDAKGNCTSVNAYNDSEYHDY